MGKHIYFNQGQYAPGTTEGRRLLAHEVVHTLQQGHRNNKSVVQRTFDPSAPCAGIDSDNPIRRIIVDQETPQQVTLFYENGSTESDECSTGKGQCCVPADDTDGTIATVPQSHENGSNCTPIGEMTVDFKNPVTAGGIPYWTSIDRTRGVALHQYSIVDGTPLSHGCIRLNENTAQKIFCGSTEGRTKVLVRGFARPRCNHSKLINEWMMDFNTASQPLDGEEVDQRQRRSIRNARASLRRAYNFGNDDTRLDEKIDEVRESAGGQIPDRRSSVSNDQRSSLRPLIPRCTSDGPVFNQEEARLRNSSETTPSTAAQLQGESGI